MPRVIDDIIDIVPAILFISSVFVLNRSEKFHNFVTWMDNIEFKIKGRKFYIGKIRFKRAKYEKKTIWFVFKEYGRKINYIDAKILELIHSGKTTMSQIEKHSGLYTEQVKYRIRKMRRFELVSEERLELHNTLDTYFKYSPLVDFITLSKYGTCNKSGCNKHRIVTKTQPKIVVSFNPRNLYNALILSMLMFAVIGSVVITYPGRLFGDEGGVALVTTFVAAVVFGASAVGSKLLSSNHPTRLYRLKIVQLYNWMGPLVRYTGISGIAVLFGILIHFDTIFKPTDLQYSPELYVMAHVIAVLIAAATVAMSWTISAKL